MRWSIDEPFNNIVNKDRFPQVFFSILAEQFGLNKAEVGTWVCMSV